MTLLTAPSPPAGALPRRGRALALALLLVATALLAGCAEKHPPADPAVVRAVADTQAMSWMPGNHWDYKAVYRENRTFFVSLIVHEAHAQGFHLGSNSSAGFFGLPFTGNVTRDLNPRIGSEVWPMFQFPLNDGQSWEYELFGYDAKSTARAALIDVPGVGAVPGFHIEATAYGQTFARYDYTSLTGWFTRLELIEPTDRSLVLDVTLQSFGADFRGDYYYERTLREVRLDFPGMPQQTAEVVIPTGYRQVRAHLVAEAAAGALDAVLTDEKGRTVANAQVLAKGTSAKSVTARTLGTWTLEAKGAGAGFVYLEVTGLAATGKNVPPPRAGAQAGESFSLLALLQSTRPVLPHTGQDTSTG